MSAGTGRKAATSEGETERPADRVGRQFLAAAPHPMYVGASTTHVRMRAGCLWERTRSLWPSASPGSTTGGLTARIELVLPAEFEYSYRASIATEYNPQTHVDAEVRFEVVSVSAKR